MKAVCVLDSQTNKKGVTGVVYLEETADKKTRIYGSIKGLRPGLHGFHIHEAGDMTKGCDSACSHYNPYGHNHGGLTSKKRHVGDLGNVEAGKNGVAMIDIVDRFVKLRGKYSVIGRSLVVHEDEDDLGNGNHDDILCIMITTSVFSKFRPLPQYLAFKNKFGISPLLNFPNKLVM